MEALVALSLASNVMQVVSFSRELLSVARQAYEAGSVEGDLSNRASHLSALVTELEKSLASSTAPLSPAQNDLRRAAEKCRDASVKIQNEIGKLCAPAGTSTGIGRAFGTSVKMMLRKNNLKELEKSMSHWQAAIDSGLLLRLCSMNEAQDIANRVDFSKLDSNIRGVVEQLAQGKTQLSEIVTKESSGIQLHVTAEISNSKDLLSREIAARAQETQEGISQGLAELRLASITETKREKLLRSLKFNDMRHRENMVKESHGGTFEWIFSPELRSWSSFTEWLGSDEKLYWISGKPGSGKSTLMKFIVGNQQTRTYAKPSTILLSHFLWRPGNQLQKTIRGILLSLLHQLLLEEASLADLVLQLTKRADYKNQDSDWSFPELSLCLTKALTSCSRPILILIDGLDEIDPEDGPVDLIDLVGEASSVSGVKFCVSSRPEPVFQKRYSVYPRLRLQDLTRADIEKVCMEALSRFSSNEVDEWRESEAGLNRLRGLTRILVEKAEGVFLWVHLALKSIQRGASNSDPWDTILRRVNALPAGLDELYRSIWKRATVDNGIYEREAALYFNLFLEAKDRIKAPLFKRPGRVSVFELILASHTALNTLVLDGQHCPTPQGLKSQCVFFMGRIEACCAGLIEFKAANSSDVIREFLSGKWDCLIPLTDLMVNFVHRTASDFLTDSEDGRAILQRDDKNQEDRIVMLIRAAMAQYKIWHIPNEDLLYYDELLFGLKRQECFIPKLIFRQLLVQCETIWISRLLQVKSKWPKVQLPDFLGKVTAYGFYTFVEARLAEIEAEVSQRISQGYKNYLLCQASRATVSHHTNVLLEGKVRLIQWLILNNGDPFSKSFYAQESFGLKPTERVWVTPCVTGMIILGIEVLTKTSLKLSERDLNVMKDLFNTVNDIMPTWAAKNQGTTDKRIPLALGLYKRFNPSSVWFRIRPSPSDIRTASMFPSGFFEANTPTLWYLFSSLVKVNFPNIHNNTCLSPDVALDRENQGNECTQPLLRVIGFRTRREMFYARYTPPAAVSHLHVLPKLAALIGRSGGITTDGQTSPPDCRGFLEFVIKYAGPDFEEVGLKGIYNALQDYTFDWPAPLQDAMLFPPPMFES